MRGYYKLFVLLTAIMVFSTMIHAQKIAYNDNWGNHGFSLLEDDGNTIRINYSLEEFYFEGLDLDGEQFKSVKVPGIFLPNNEGYPDLAGTGKYVAIPQGAKVTYSVIASRTEKINNIDIAPAPRIPLDTEDGPLHYEKNIKIYSQNAFYPAENIKLKTSKIRGVDMVMVGITPFQYNPVTKELIVYRDLQVELTISGGTGHVGDDRLRSRWWDPIIHDAVLNPNSIPVMDYTVKPKSSKTAECEYIIIIPNDPVFISYAEQIKSWRSLQGIQTDIAILGIDITGNTVAEIEAFVDNAYNNWDTPPSAVLLLGDYGTGTSGITSQWYTHPGGYPDFVSDNRFADVDNDELPDIAFARITANNATELGVMVSKFLDYENNPPANFDFYDHPITALGWQTERWFQICSEVAGGFFKNSLGKNPVRINAIYSGTPGTVWSTATNTATVVNYFGPSGLEYIPATPSELGGWSGGTAADVVNAINAGSFMLQHRDHGFYGGWGEPDFTTSNIGSLTNINNQLPYIFSINCQTGAFHNSSETFTEMFHRYTYGGENSGALGVLAATEVSYSFVNDTYLWGVMDNLFPNFMPAENAEFPVNYVMPAFGNAAGKHFLYQSSWPYNTSDKLITYRLFHHHGDAFMTVYTEVPQNLTVGHSDELFIGTSSFEVIADEGSLIALTVGEGEDIEIIGTGEGTGSPVSISIIPQISEGTMTVTVTKQNYYRYSSLVNVASPPGPHVVYNSHTINDASGNGNGEADFNENILLDLTVGNVGLATAYNVTVTLNCSDPYITIADDTESYGTISSGATSTISDAFSFSIANDIPDQHLINFNISISGDADEIWNSSFDIVANAPQLEVGSLTIDDAVGGDGNGMLDPGETANIIIESSNIGHSLSPIANASLNSTSSGITLNTTSFDLGQIAIDTTANASFSVTVSPSAQIGTTVDLNFDVLAGSYSSNKSFVASIGLMIEDWETGDFTKYPWTIGGSGIWIIESVDPFEGVYCAKSDTITHSQVSDMETTVDVTNDGTMSFYRKVSSESGYDYLKFFVDGVLMDEWAGEIAWGKVSFPVLAGIHTFKWQYYKDGSVSNGSDCAWVDYIIFPYPVPPLVPPYQTNFDEAGSMPERWYNGSDDDINWTLYSGSTGSTGTGPSGDHTTGSGYYMYTESSDPNFPSKQADLITPLFDLSSFADVEIRFWYHMYGAEMGELHLDIYHNDIWTNDIMIAISGNQGDVWHEQVVDLTSYAGEIIKLRFRGITGTSYTSDMALDDFSINGTIIEPGISFNLTAFLEGPFVSTEMTTSLNSSGYLPLSQPYYISPWNYTGTESVATIPNVDIVDWVLVELRETAGDVSTATPATVIAQKAGFILKDGSVVDTDGISSLRFDINVTANLYAIVYHRNHLGILSAYPLAIIGESCTYNFTTNLGQVYGDLNGHIEVVPGIWGMTSGDADADGEIHNKDKNEFWKIEVGSNGYFNSDFDMNGSVDMNDKIGNWKVNSGNCSFIVK